MHRRVWFLAAAAVVACSRRELRCRHEDDHGLAGGREVLVREGVASIPRTPAARQAKKTVNFAMEQDAGGFNLANQDFTGAWAAYFGETPIIRGNYIIDNKGNYTSTSRRRSWPRRSPSRSTIRKDAKWYWIGHKPFPVTAADYIYTWKQIVKPGNNVASTVGYNLITRAKVAAKGKMVTFYWKSRSPTTRTCSATSIRRRRSKGQSFNTFWSDCVCGYPDKQADLGWPVLPRELDAGRRPDPQVQQQVVRQEAGCQRRSSASSTPTRRPRSTP